MKITLDNYEQFVLDFLEGNLSLHEEMTFEEFLESHPTIRDEIRGVDRLVLIPDDQLVYPDKSSLYRRERLIVIPFWNVSRTVAAAVGLLVVTSATFFIWKSSMNQSWLQPYENQLTITNPGIDQTNLPAAGTLMPENQPRSEEALSDTDMITPLQDVSQPESNVMVQQENESKESDNLQRPSPTLVSGSLKKNVRSEQTILKTIDETTVKEVNPIHQIAEAEEKSFSPDLEVSPPPNINNEATTIVAFLPLKSSEIASKETRDLPIMVTFQPDLESQTYKIHIPGQFLSETWTDVSLTNFKKKLIPTFIKNQLNL